MLHVNGVFLLFFKEDLVLNFSGFLFFSYDGNVIVKLEQPLESPDADLPPLEEQEQEELDDMVETVQNRWIFYYLFRINLRFYQFCLSTSFLVVRVNSRKW
jgi:hypothetical protein